VIFLLFLPALTPAQAQFWLTLQPLFSLVATGEELEMGASSYILNSKSNVIPAHNPKSQYNLDLLITGSTVIAGTLSLRNYDRTINIRNNDRFLSQFRRLKVLT